MSQERVYFAKRQKRIDQIENADTTVQCYSETWPVEGAEGRGNAANLWS